MTFHRALIVAGFLLFAAALGFWCSPAAGCVFAAISLGGFGVLFEDW